MAFKQLWFWKNRQLTDRWAEVYAFSSEEYKRPSVVISLDGICHSETEPIWYSTVDGEGNLVINWCDNETMEKVPPMWYVVKETPRPHPYGPDIPCIFVFAFYGDDFPSGTIVMEQDLIDRGFISHSERVGHVIWFKNDAKLQQVTVVEKWQRKRVTVALFGVADLVIVSGGYPRFLHGGEITTEDGEALRKAWGGSPRLVDRIGSVSQEAIEPI